MNRNPTKDTGEADDSRRPTGNMPILATVHQCTEQLRFIPNQLGTKDITFQLLGLLTSTNSGSRFSVFGVLSWTIVLPWLALQCGSILPCQIARM